MVASRGRRGGEMIWIGMKVDLCMMPAGFMILIISSVERLLDIVVLATNTCCNAIGAKERHENGST